MRYASAKQLRICMELDGKYGLKAVKWTDVYGNEEELIEALKKITVPSDKMAPINTFKGYEYIYSFATRLQNGKQLSEAQLRQAKRLAREIEKAVAIEEA